MTTSDPTARDCRWIAVPGHTDGRGSINFLEFGKGLDFRPQRIFWLHHIAPGQWRGRHGHRESRLVFVPLAGGCDVSLDDGSIIETVRLDDPARALYVGTWVWHELTRFTPDAAILVLASTLYDNDEYLRDYDEFKRDVARRGA
ncbi:MAG: WxcM-like domain-containing protein [Alphaproteobacteria bacterium]|nr:WxcM-like domain-containing protein [Alphaproteobacteria bacterium]